MAQDQVRFERNIYSMKLSHTLNCVVESMSNLRYPNTQRIQVLIPLLLCLHGKVHTG